MEISTYVKRSPYLLHPYIAYIVEICVKNTVQCALTLLEHLLSVSHKHKNEHFHLFKVYLLMLYKSLTFFKYFVLLPLSVFCKDGLKSGKFLKCV